MVCYNGLECLGPKWPVNVRIWDWRTKLLWSSNLKQLLALFVVRFVKSCSYSDQKISMKCWWKCNNHRYGTHVLNGGENSSALFWKMAYNWPVSCSEIYNHIRLWLSILQVSFWKTCFHDCTFLHISVGEVATYISQKAVANNMLEFLDWALSAVQR